jgi:adenosine deaminase
MYKDITRQTIYDLPKAELHIHLEGTLEPEMIEALARKYKVEVPDSVLALRAPFDLDRFFKAYTDAVSLMRESQDFAEALSAYLSKAKEQGVLYAEVMVDM